MITNKRNKNRTKYKYKDNNRWGVFITIRLIYLSKTTL
jgi:hypothetical protein